MNVQMKDGLPAVRHRIEDEPIAICIDALLNSNLSSRGEELRQESFILGFQILQRLDVLDRYDQNVDGRYGMNIAERDHLLIPVQDRRAALSADYSAEWT